MGDWKATVVVLVPLVAVIVLVLLPWSVKLWAPTPTVKAPVFAMVFTARLPATFTLPVKLELLPMVWPLIAPELTVPPTLRLPLVVRLPLDATVSLLLPLTCKSRRLPVAAAFVLLIVSILPLAWLLTTLSCANDGAEVVAISWAVSTVPLVTLKLVLLKAARPFVVLVASLIVITPPTVLTLLPAVPWIVIAPFALLTVVTPPDPGQVVKPGVVPVITRHCPLLPVAVFTALVPFPTSTPLLVKLLRPVPPLETARGFVRLRLAKVGVLVTAIS